MTSSSNSDPRQLFSNQLKEATRATNEEQSIRQQTLQFNLVLAAENAIETLYPRQGVLNDIHTDQLLQKFKMSQQKQQTTSATAVERSPARASSASRAIALPASTTGGSPSKKAFEVVSVSVGGKAKKKKKTESPVESDDDDSDSSDAAAPYIDGTADEPVVVKQKKQNKQRTADDGSGDDGEGSFDETLSKKKKSKKRIVDDADDDDDESLGSKDSVDLDIESLNEDDDDIVDDESEESDDDDDDAEGDVDDEVAQRLRVARNEVERKFKKGHVGTSESSDDDDDFTDNKANDDDDDDDGEESDEESGSADDDDEEKRPRKLAKNSLSHAAASSSKHSKKTTSSMALDVDSAHAAKKKKHSSTGGGASKPTAAASTGNAAIVKEALEEQRKRKADRRENDDWVTKTALTTVISVACSQVFRRHLAKEKKTTNVSYFDLIMKDESDDAELQEMRGNLLAVSTIIQESLTIASNGSPKEMREIEDFVRNAKEVRSSSATNTTHTECGITGVTATAAAIELLEADHYTADGKTFTKKIFALKTLRKLIDSTAFLVNFHERCEQIVKDRLVHIKGYAPKMLVRDYIKLLEDDPAQKNAYTLLRTALKVHLDVLDMSLTIFKQSH